MPAHVSKRIERIRAKKPEVVQKHIKRSPFDNLTYEAVLCPCCRKPVRGMAEDDRFRTTRRENGKVVERVPMVFVSLPNLQEIIIEMDEAGGTLGAHHTFVCRDCVNHLDADDLEAIYAANMMEWEHEESHKGGPVNWERMNARTPRGFRLAEDIS